MSLVLIDVGIDTEDRWRSALAWGQRRADDSISSPRDLEKPGFIIRHFPRA